MLKMTHLSKAYRTEVVETFALRDFSIHVREGEFVAVTGPSGSGKTTFLTIAGLLEEFTGGEYALDGADVRGLNDNQRSRLRNELYSGLGTLVAQTPGYHVAADGSVYSDAYSAEHIASLRKRIDRRFHTPLQVAHVVIKLARILNWRVKARALLTIMACLAGVLSSVWEVFKENPIFRRECAAGLSPGGAS